MTGCEDWFTDWIEAHQRRHPSRSWTPSTDLLYYEGWIEAFERAGITRGLAEAVSRRMQTQSLHPGKHLQAFLELARVVRREHAPSPAAGAPLNPGQADAARQSAHCPECRGAGWATRRAVWLSPGRALICAVDLFCRCPHGRWRKEHDPDLQTPDGLRNHDDLQARPELWDRALSSPGWDRRPVAPDVEIDADCAGRWRYLLPGEQTPEGATAIGEALFSKGAS